MIDFSTLRVFPLLPNYFHFEQGNPLPKGLVGSIIVRMGTIPASGEVEGGGLVIDYRRPGSKKTRRVVLAFNELAMWVEHESYPR